MVRSTARWLRSPAAAFAWRAWLVLLPVVLLSVVALLSVRRDRAAIERDAREQARVLAADLARALGTRAAAAIADALRANLPRGDAATRSADRASITPGDLAPTAGLIANGRIRYPTDRTPLPDPPAWFFALSGEHRRLLSNVDVALYGQRDDRLVREALAALLASGPPPPLRAYADWLALRQGLGRLDAAESTRRLLDFASRYPDAVSDSGTPLTDIALLWALRRMEPGSMPPSLIDHLDRRGRERPSWLTGEVMAEARRVTAGTPLQAAAEAAHTRWRAHERTLDAMAGLQRATAPSSRSGPAWVVPDREPILVLARQVGPLAVLETGVPPPAWHVVVVPRQAIRAYFTRAAGSEDVRVPPWAAVAISLAGVEWLLHPDAQGETDSPPTPASGAAPGAAAAPGPASAASAVPVVTLASAEGAIDVPTELGSDILTTHPPSAMWTDASLPPPGSSAAPAVVRLQSAPGGCPFTVTVRLSHPALLYGGYRQRLWLSVGLVLAAAAAAMFGLASTWRAFRRQSHLAAMKSNFVASVSHEFRAPVASVRLMAESLERGAVQDPDRRRDYLRLIIQECRRLSSLVENVLDFSRIDQGRARYAFEPADLDALVQHAVGLMAPYASERQVRLELARGTPWPDGVIPQCDPRALQQALVNLIDNAVKHSPPGSTVTVAHECAATGERGRTGGDAGAAPVVRLSVADQGPGIPAEDRARIFEPFYRRGSELRRETQGIGIGLSIVRHVAEAHGGSVDVESEVGRGSRFTLTFPAWRAREAAGRVVHTEPGT